MRSFLTIALPWVAILVFATSGLALEKVAVQADRAARDDWEGAATCTVTYANICTGWIWIWSGWSPTDIVGVTFDASECCYPGGGPIVVATQAYFWTGAPSGYGFTGTLALQTVDVNLCPVAVIYSRPYLPDGYAAVDFWNVPANRIALTYQSGPMPGSPHTLPTDHPAAGPTGPQPCGLCYPTTRAIHTFYFGNATTALCPGSPLNDGVCDTEALSWYAQFICPISVEENSWGAVKNLYR